MKQKKRWSNFLVDSEKWIEPRLVSELTEGEAKDQLCNCIDLIEKMQLKAVESVDLVEVWRSK